MRAILAVSFCVVFSARGEIARWADATIPVTNGLELWLDATRENEAREAHYMNRLADGQAMDLWHDSSGKSRHLAQWSSIFRPLWKGGSVEFLGDDYLAALLTPGLEGRECTIFIVAAPDRAGGDFPALFSAARRDEHDYTSGLTIDFGRAPGPDGLVDFLNVEGAGQTGERNLFLKPVATQRGHVFTVTSIGKESTARVDGEAHGKRDRGDVAFAMDRVAVGARFVEPEMRHFFHGRIAEVVFFNRSLVADEIAKVEDWLKSKHAGFLRPSAPLAPRGAEKEQPIVQMFVPGFTVEELPVKVTNLNNIEYAPDGRLFAAGYDGRFHLLRDTDGDGLEDKLDTFSGETSDNYPLGMVVKDGMPHALLSDEIVRFRYSDGDGVPDQRETVAKGWDDPKLRDDPALMHRRVDSAMALAAGPDGSWYVTMGSANPGNGYWQKAEGDIWSPDAVKTGKPAYSPDKRRGCLLRISPDGKVEQLSSGLRYIMSLQWDRHGELFATDQEGATWLPNGNPFDELLHLQTGRHYGFPPRHPKLLPDVIDEPSVWDYSPQHQSACGFRFNGPAKDRPRFGPEFWAHDAIVTGESRGKLWRTTLEKTAAGYVAGNQLFASVGMLITDCTISPKGELVICCHSGPPDWGSGPAKDGRLFKIRYANPDAPQPVLVCAVDPTTTAITFDRPLTAIDWQNLAQRVHVEGGRFVGAGDRFEAIRPGYAVVRAQQGEPRFDLAVTAAALGGDGRSLVIKTEPRTKAVGYAIALDVPRKEEGIKQADAIDLAHTLGGLAATWKGKDASGWAGWLPHPDFAVAKTLTRGSATHDAAWDRLSQPGKLVLQTKLDLSHLLQPAVQPGAKLDYTPEPETVTITLTSDAAISVDAPGCLVKSGGRSVSFTKKVTSDDWQDLTIEFATPATTLEATFTTAIDSRPRPLGIRRFLMPFATKPAPMATTSAIPQIAGGNYANGHRLFMGKATCFTCHQMRGEGNAVGPDLSNTAHRDYASVLRDLEDPNATINPDAVAYQLTLKNGGSAVGTRIGETETELKLAAPGGTVTTVNKSEILKTAALPVSLMPPGLLSVLSEQERKDLMAFLLTSPQRDE
jgi:putative heme-binding domain-containing protein